MQDRYAGDVGDFGKFGLLRHLCGVTAQDKHGRLEKPGVIWYKTIPGTRENASDFGFFGAHNFGIPSLHVPRYQRFKCGVAHRPHMLGVRMDSLLLSCMTLSFTTSRRFIPTLSGPKAHPNRQRISGKVRRKFMSVLSVPSDGGYTLLSTLRCAFKRRSTSWRGSSKAEAICSAPSPRRCMRSAWERLPRFSPGLGSPGGGATGV